MHRCLGLDGLRLLLLHLLHLLDLLDLHLLHLHLLLLWLFVLDDGRSLVQLVLGLLLLTLRNTVGWILLVWSALVIILSLLLLLIRVLHLLLLHRFECLLVRNRCFVSVFGRFHYDARNRTILLLRLPLILYILRHWFLLLWHLWVLILHRLLLQRNLLPNPLILRIRHLALGQLPLLWRTLGLHRHDLLLLVQLILFDLLNLSLILLVAFELS